MEIQTFRDLKVWQMGMSIAKEVISATRSMPKSEMFAMTSQMRRAASSIPMNIAEGYGKHTRPAYVYGLRTAMGSLYELMTAYELSVAVGYIKPNPALESLLPQEDRMLKALIAKIEAIEKAQVSRKRRSKQLSQPLPPSTP